MKNNTIKQHWEEIYKTKDTINDVSWYQKIPKASIECIVSTGVKKEDNIIDIGGGDSNLVDSLIEMDFKNLFVLDISATALSKTKTRLGNKGNSVTWIVSDVLDFETKTHFDVWHDRATFHFLTTQEDVNSYVALTTRLIKPNGYLILSTFSTSGPKKCSGLEITQYSESLIKKIFNENFFHIKSFERLHTTPSGAQQNFLWSIFKRSIKN